ncbi:MAG TPA: TPM domain-containing protein, partial [Stenomitos sp.]
CMLPLNSGVALATGVADIPIVQAGSDPWVIDQGKVLSLLSQGAVEKKLSQLAEKTGMEVRFVTIRRFDYGQTAATLTDGLFDRWFPTPEAQANQALLLLDTQTNTSSIRTGEGVKRLLSDDVAQSVASETLLVPIREDNYNQGLLDAANRLSLVLSGQPDPGPPEIKVAEVESTFTKAEDTDDRSAGIIVIVLLVLATVIPMATYYWYQRG